MDRPLDIGNVHNMSLEPYSSNGEVPLLVAQFSCDCESEAGYDWLHVGEDELYWVYCAVIQLYDSQNITLKGISITHQTPCMSGVVFRYVSNVIVQHIAVFSLISPSKMDLQIGILIHSANVVELYSLYACKHSYGFVLQYINNTYIANITVTDNGSPLSSREYSRGINLEHATNTTIISPTVKHNIEGMYFYCATNTTVTDACVKHNDFNGMIFDNVINTTILNVNVMSNFVGIDFRHSTNTLTANSIVLHNRESGIVLENSTNTSIINLTAIDNAVDGITLIQSEKTDIIDATLLYNTENGISVIQSTNTCIVNPKTYSLPDYEISIIQRCCYIFIVSSSCTKIYNSSFTDIGATPIGASSANPTTLPAVIVLYYSSLYISGCNFTENSVSGVKAYASNITTSGDLVFSNNRAIAGTAFILLQKSILKLAENCHIYFSSNYVTNIGGVSFITNNMYYEAQPDEVSYYDHYKSGPPLVKSTCLLSTEGNRSQVRLTFVNNSAERGGDIVHGGHLAYGLDGD